MKPKSSNAKSPVKAPAERVVKDIRRQTRRHFSAEWNRIPAEIHDQIIELALEATDQSPRVGRAVHRRAALLRVGIDGLPAAQGP